MERCAVRRAPMSGKSTITDVPIYKEVVDVESCLGPGTGSRGKVPLCE